MLVEFQTEFTNTACLTCLNGTPLKTLTFEKKAKVNIEVVSDLKIITYNKIHYKIIIVLKLCILSI